VIWKIVDVSCFNLVYLYTKANWEYDRLVEDGVVGNRIVYFIYPSMDSHVYVLRSASRAREYIRCDKLDDFIRFVSGIWYPRNGRL